MTVLVLVPEPVGGQPATPARSALRPLGLAEVTRTLRIRISRLVAPAVHCAGQACRRWAHG